MKNKNEKIIRPAPATNPEDRENQMIALAVNLAEQQLRDGTASSQVITHYLKLGSTKERLEKDILEKKARGVDFQWLGVKKPVEIRELLADCDFMILPSSSEGFGLVYLEAIACGVPVIIPKDLPLALEGGILNENNAIRINGCSAEAIEEVLPSLPQREWNRKEVSQTIVSYTWDNIAREYRDIYSSIIN